MVASSVISYYFYFGLIRQMFMRSTNDADVQVPATSGIVIWLCAVATVALGVVPGPVLDWVNGHFTIMNDLFVQLVP